jgi:hypothetical protein
MRNLPFDPESAGILPHAGHEAIAARPVGKSFAKPSKRFSFVKLAYLGMDQQSQASLRVAVFFYELIVSRPAPKLSGKDLFKKFIEITVEVIHPLAGKLLVTPDMAQMKGKTNLL